MTCTDIYYSGKDNFAADRGAAEQLLAAIPDAAAIARDNRSFLGRAVRYIATAGGVRQFLDLGSGLPTQANVHQLAQGVAPQARVVYVDNDPMVASHGRALLAAAGGAAMVFGDLRGPGSILAHPEVTGLLDLSRPVALLCTSTLHFISGDDLPHRIITGYRDRLAPGSYLVITHGTVEDDPGGEAGQAAGVYREASSQLYVRPLAEVRRLFDGFELIDPGLAWITEWRPEPGTEPRGRQHSLRGGVGRKP